MSTRRRTTVDDNPHYDEEYGPAPRALRYAEKANAAGKLIVDALPDIKMEQTRHNKDCRYDPL